MKKTNYYFAIISEGSIVLYKTKESCKIVSFSPLYDIVLENITAWTEPLTGILHITGDQRVYHIFFDRIYEKDWEEEPDENYIKTRRTWFTRKLERYLEGWTLMKKRKPYQSMFKSWNVRIEG